MFCGVCESSAAFVKNTKDNKRKRRREKVSESERESERERERKWVRETDLCFWIEFKHLSRYILGVSFEIVFILQLFYTYCEDGIIFSPYSWGRLKYKYSWSILMKFFEILIRRSIKTCFIKTLLPKTRIHCIVYCMVCVVAAATWPWVRIGE